jgi:hypothetical protein
MKKWGRVGVYRKPSKAEMHMGWDIGRAAPFQTHLYKLLVQQMTAQCTTKDNDAHTGQPSTD